MPPDPSGRGRELPLGFEPVVPVGADGQAPRQPEVVGVDRDLLGGGTPVLSPRAEGRRNATRLDPQRLDFARRRGRRRFVLAGRGRGLGGSLPAGWALELDPLRLGFGRRRGRRWFALAGRGRSLGGSLPAGWALGHVRSLTTWAARADTRLRERLACGPGLPLPQAGGWFASTPLARSDPGIRTAAAAAEPSGGV